MTESQLIVWRFRAQECTVALREVLRYLSSKEDLDLEGRRVVNRAKFILEEYDLIEEECHAR